MTTNTNNEPCVKSITITRYGRKDKLTGEVAFFVGDSNYNSSEFKVQLDEEAIAELTIAMSRVLVEHSRRLADNITMSILGSTAVARAQLATAIPAPTRVDDSDSNVEAESGAEEAQLSALDDDDDFL